MSRNKTKPFCIETNEGKVARWHKVGPIVSLLNSDMLQKIGPKCVAKIGPNVPAGGLKIQRLCSLYWLHFSQMNNPHL